jgi:hypothetical protein
MDDKPSSMITHSASRTRKNGRSAGQIHPRLAEEGGEVVFRGRRFGMFSCEHGHTYMLATRSRLRPRPRTAAKSRRIRCLSRLRDEVEEMPMISYEKL